MGVKTNVLTFFGLYTLKADELGIALTLGKYTGDVTPGLGFAIPIIQSVIKTKASVQTLDLPDQKIVLSGNISVKISGSVNFRVRNAKRAILGVDDYTYSLRQLALTTISDVLGIKTIEEIRANKRSIADEIEQIVAKSASEWGLANVDIRLTDAEMDDKLMRAMMRETEAEKEASAIEIKAKADQNVASIFAQAASQLAGSPGAMTLRILQTLSDLSNSKSTVVIPLPIDLLSNITGGNRPNVNMDTDSTSTMSFNQLGSNLNQDTASNTTRISKVYSVESKSKANCPHCGKIYKVDNVLENKTRFDRDAEMPGLQLKCKVCEKLFTLAEV